MKNVRINKNPQNIDKTIALMQDALPMAMLQTEGIARVIAQKKGQKNQVEALFIYLQETYRYHADPEGSEYIRLPAQNYKDRKKGIDCEDYSLEAAAVLVQLGFVPEYKVVDYDSLGWSHIYVVAHTKTQSFILDAVHAQFNVEDNYVKSVKRPVASKANLVRSLGKGLNDDIRIAQLSLYLARKELQIEGDHHGWFGRRTPEDKKRVAKVEKFEKQLSQLRNRQAGLGSLLWQMSLPDLEATRNRLLAVRKNYADGTKQYKDISSRIAEYGTEIKSRKDNGFLGDAPTTSELLKMRGLGGRESDLNAAELASLIRQKEASARYLANGRKGAWGRRTNADDKREAELRSLNLRLSFLLRTEEANKGKLDRLNRLKQKYQK